MVGRINIIMVIELLVLREKQIGMRSGCKKKKKIVTQVQSDCRLDRHRGESGPTAEVNGAAVTAL